MKRGRGDSVTPIGSFIIGHPRPSSRFLVFIPLYYPSLEIAERALSNGIISAASLQRIKKAIEKHRQPPQDTPLGGNLGIHGIGKGRLEIHHMADWTTGCVALDNRQIKKLASLIIPGTHAEIR